MSEAKVTTDHATIRKWAEQRGGVPSAVEATGSKDDVGILRLDFEPKDKDLGKIDWDKFFDKFDEKKLAFIYQDKTDDGSISRFHKFVDRASAKTH
ncbi:MAG TPA: hypothetical protein VHD14_06160 [Pseudolabrys sp.]|jgi:hypothetical protein|nr:hypothetical protein [Pseudolabrys sp.]